MGSQRGSRGGALGWHAGAGIGPVPVDETGSARLTKPVDQHSRGRASARLGQISAVQRGLPLPYLSTAPATRTKFRPSSSPSSHSLTSPRTLVRTSSA